MKEIIFATNLKSLRLSKQMKQYELAKLLNVDKRTISAWENKVCEPSLAMLAKLCEIFDESFDNILT
ncbi:MAG: helix-turn-helix domain-containing protein [Clostridiales bacterium]|nr:helix-turn-helix domain-containing protein [Clostridiales bacterium]